MTKLLWFMFFLAFAMFAVFGLVLLEHLSVDIEAELAASADALNEDVPRVVDPHTDFLGVRAEGREIVYLFRMHGISMQKMAESEAEMRSSRLDNIQSDPNMQRLLNRGVRMSWEYFVGDELALSFSIDKDSQS